MSARLTPLGQAIRNLYEAPERWSIFIDFGDGQGFRDDGGDILPSREEAEASAKRTESLAELIGLPIPKWEARRIVGLVTEGDSVEALRARVSTLVQTEARAVAGEKAAREALAQATATVQELTDRYASSTKVEA